MFAKSLKKTRPTFCALSTILRKNKCSAHHHQATITRATCCPANKFNSQKKPLTTACSQVKNGLRLQHVAATMKTSSDISPPPLPVNVLRNDKKKWMDVIWNDGSQTSYPYVWLRDNCQCPNCFHPVSKARLVLMMNLDPDVQPEDVHVDDDGNITITWPDGHRSPCKSKWLWKRAFTERAREKRNDIFKQHHQHWGAEMQGKIPTYDYEKICSDDDDYLLDWLIELDRYGMTLVRNAPSGSPGHLSKIAARICFARKTSYGESFKVESKTDPSNLAYTNAKLGFHCDLTYYLHVPGVQFLHCLKNTSAGGQNQFVDATYAAKIMEVEHPEYFKLLCDNILDFNDIGIDAYKFNMVSQWPVFIRNMQGRVTSVRYNNQSRDTYMNGVPLEKVQPVYKAMRLLDNIMYDPRNHVTHSPKAGDIAVFDNTRVLHARDAYDVGSSGSRHLEGMYIDWDEVFSRIRVLKEDLGR